jgi:hypothetical protein
MLTFPDVLDFFAHEFTGLSRWRFSLFFVFACPFKSFFLRHDAPFRTRILRQSIGAQRKDNLNTANRLEMFNTGTRFVKNRDASVRKDSLRRSQWRSKNFFANVRLAPHEQGVTSKSLRRANHCRIVRCGRTQDRTNGG